MSAMYQGTRASVLSRESAALPERHEGHCVGGGTGHSPARHVRGFWPGMEADIAAARERHPND